MKMKVTKKRLLYIFLFIILILIALSGTIMSQVSEPKYTVISSEANMEIREYAPILVAQVTVTGEREPAISAGFRLLADYIFGNNEGSQKIKMTAPVVQQEGEKIAMTAPVIQQESPGQSALECAIRYACRIYYANVASPQKQFDSDHVDSR